MTITRTAEDDRAIVRRHVDGASWRRVVSYTSLVSVVILGVLVRLPGLTSKGLWRDDAWTALASRVGMAQALRISTTTPGFTLLSRGWVGLVPGSSLWAQCLPLIFGVAGIIAIYLLVRYFRLPRWEALLAALAVASSPVAIQYSTHLKQYSLDFLLACLLLWVGETVRREPTNLGLLRALSALSVIAIFVSASVLPIAGGVWAILFLDGMTRRRDRRTLFKFLAPPAASVAAFYALRLRYLPSALHHYWALRGAFIDPSSPTALQHTITHTINALTVGLIATAGHIGPIGGLSWRSGDVLLPATILGLLVVVGLTAGRHAMSSAVALLIAVLASAAGVVPLGTGRTDEAVYPAMLLLAAFGIQRLVRPARAWLASRLHWHPSFDLAFLTVGVALFVTITLLSNQVRHPPRYPEVDVRSLASQMNPRQLPGDQVLIDPETRFPWTLYEARRVRLAFNTRWVTGFSVVSDDPIVFVAPAGLYYEAGYAPLQWARHVEDAGRVWYVATGFAPSPIDPVYRALTSQGWRIASTFHARGGFALLMVGGGTPPGRLLQHALQERVRGDLAAAFNTYHAVLEKDPRNVYAYTNLALIDRSRGRPDQAVLDDRMALSIAPTFTPSMLDLAELLTLGHPLQAMALYRRVLAITPSDANAELNLGLLLLRSGFRVEGRMHVERAVQLDPSLRGGLPSRLVGAL